MKALRFLPLPLLTAVAFFAAGAASAQGWKEYVFNQAGFAAQFPAEPGMETRPYSSSAGALTERIYSANSGGVIYMVSITDFPRGQTGKDSAIDEAANALIAVGRLTHDVSARLDWNYGREIRVVGPDGTSYTDAIFFFENKLLQLKVVYPEMNSDPNGSSGIHFFQEAFRLTF